MVFRIELKHWRMERRKSNWIIKKQQNQQKQKKSDF
jgi:hypothetical protein